MSKPRIAIQNIHRLANLTNWQIHNYVLELVRKGHVEYLYFDLPRSLAEARSDIAIIRQILDKYGWGGLGIHRAKLLFSGAALRDKCDILLNFNGASAIDFTPAIRDFPGIKIFHVMDYFWREPASKRNANLESHGVNYLMSYARSDRDCAFFAKSFPKYVNRVIPVPFGFSSRFVQTRALEDRKKKCIALGSVNPLRPADADEWKYKEPADFFSNEEWFHAFRRAIVENLPSLSTEIDSLLPVFPQYKDSSYDIVKTLNEYRMFTSDESIFHFPPAKAFEGPACGSALVCSDHPCFAEYGFQKDISAIVYEQSDVRSLQEQIHRYQQDPAGLLRVQQAGQALVTRYYSHEAVARNLSAIFRGLFANHQQTAPLDFSETRFWPQFDFSHSSHV